MEQSKLNVEKWIWNDADFESMSWHDCQLHGVARYEKVERDQEKASERHFSGIELLLDIDYILRWVTSDPNEWRFWIAPSTLVFDRVANFQMKIAGASLRWEIDEIVREQLRTRSAADRWKWEILPTGMEFHADGYKQYMRQEPVLTRFQSLTWEERGGVSFSKQAWTPVHRQNC